MVQGDGRAVARPYPNRPFVGPPEQKQRGRTHACAPSISVDYVIPNARMKKAN